MKSIVLNKVKMKGAATITFLLLLLSFVTYLFRPTGVVILEYNYFCFGISLISTYIYIISVKKKNYLDFETIFIVVFLIVGFAYPVFLYDENKPNLFFFGFSFDITTINTGSILFVLSLQSYYLGSIFCEKRKRFVAKPIQLINNHFLTWMVVLLAVLFISLGGVQYFQAMYNDKYKEVIGGLVMQVMVLLHAFSLIAIATEFYNKKINPNYKISNFLIITITCLVLLMLYAGNRTFASQLMLPLIVLNSIYFKSIGKFKIIIFFIGSIFCMSLIQSYRATNTVSAPRSIGKTIIDLVIVTRNTYVSLEYVENYGFTYGETMSRGVIGIIPSLERIIINDFGVDSDELGSAETLTKYTLGSKRTLGLGTNIVADIYMSFGIPGLIILMYSLGYFVRSKFIGAINLSYFSLISYTVLVSYSVFLVRSTYTHPLKLLVWCFIISKLNILLTSNKVK